MLQIQLNSASIYYQMFFLFRPLVVIEHILFQDGVILGADTRATEDTIVADKNCSKIHYIAPNI